MKNCIFSKLIKYPFLSLKRFQSAIVELMTEQINNLNSQIDNLQKRKLTNDEKKELNKKRAKIRKIQAKTELEVPNTYTEPSNIYFKDGFRRVEPYYFKYSSFAKRRWVNEYIIDVMSNEFRLHSKSDIKNRMKKGLIKVNDEYISDDYILKDQDYLTHVVHRHEFPILDKELEIVYEDNDVFVLNKPSSFPIHSTGKYHLNTVMGILINCKGRKPYRIVHRLDRLTSGVLLLAKTYASANIISKYIQEHKVSKYYLSKVIGKFNSLDPGLLICKEPLSSLCHKTALHFVDHTNGKESSTKFKLLKYDDVSDTSLVLCKPLTGRTHQIRVHLQFLGHPIVDDPLYNSLTWGPELGKSGRFHKSKDQLIVDLQQLHSMEAHENDDIMKVNGSPDTVGDNSQIGAEVNSKHFDSECLNCLKGSEQICYDIKDFQLSLHAYRYRFHEIPRDFIAEPPTWAQTFFGGDDALKQQITLLTSNDEII